MTATETIDIIRESPLWETLLLREKAEAIAHALEAAECGADGTGVRYIARDMWLDY